MATFQFGRALLCALLSLSLAASCGPGPCEGDEALCSDPDAGDGGLTDGGTDGGIGPDDPSVVTLHAPAGIDRADFFTVKNGESLPIDGCQNVSSCSYAVPIGGGHRFSVSHAGYFMIEKVISVRKTGHTYDLRWDGPGECGIAIGGDSYWAYRDENRPEWGRVYFRTDIQTDQMVTPWVTQVKLDNMGGVGVTRILSGDWYVVVTGLNFQGEYEQMGANGMVTQAFSGAFTADGESFTYHLSLRDSNGNDLGEPATGTFRRFRQ